MTTKDAQPGTRRESAPASPMKTLGRHIPNLVLIWDSESTKKPEFRVQLEVELDTETARKVAEDLWGQNVRTGPKLDDAKALVLAEVPEVASDIFKQIIKDSFDDQPEKK